MIDSYYVSLLKLLYQFSMKHLFCTYSFEWCGLFSYAYV